MNKMNHKQTIEKPKILLVDDLPANLDILVELLRDFQADLVTASSGKMALELTREHEFALILLDVQMPDLDGFETAKIILSRIDTPIIFLTAYGSEKQNIIEGYTIGAVDYLVKPFDASILKKKVSVFLLLYQQKSLLKQSNHRLNKEITERREIEQKLISAKSNLEHRVKERTK